MKKALLSISIMVLILACGPAMKTTSSWTNQDKSIFQNKIYKTIFISAMTSNLEMRMKLEEDMSIAAKKHGFAVIKSIDKFPPGINPSKEEAIEIIKKSGADLIITTALVDEKSENRYVPGATFSPTFYGGYRGYYFGSRIYYQPGYYRVEKTYFLETNLFDVASESAIWSAQSELYNPTDIQNTSEHYTDLILRKLEKDGILLKTAKK